MKNSDAWRPSKYVIRSGKLVGSGDAAELGVGSRLAGALVAQLYERYLPQYARGRLLDLGCGKVPLFETYRRFVDEVVCVDRRDSEHVDAVVDLTTTLPFRDGEFDTIILSDVLEHIATPDQLWREMARVLAKRGHIILNVPFFYQVHEQPHDYYRYTSFALARFVRESNLEMRVLLCTGGSPEIAIDLFAKHAARVPILGKTVASIVQSVAMEARKTRIGRWFSDQTSRNFPFGYFLVAEKLR